MVSVTYQFKVKIYRGSFLNCQCFKVAYVGIWIPTNWETLVNYKRIITYVALKNLCLYHSLLFCLWHLCSKNCKSYRFCLENVVLIIHNCTHFCLEKFSVSVAKTMRWQHSVKTLGIFVVLRLLLWTTIMHLGLVLLLTLYTLF